jgi:WD40 repeat protein/serine/threonine protein kinase
MSASESEVVLALAEEFLERYRQGERPSLKEYADRHPGLAAEIRQVFPAMALMENIALADESLAGPPTGDEVVRVAAPLEQLGDFRIIREIGRGGMGIVYEAEQMSLGRHVALKILPTKAVLDAKQKRRFEREARAAARLHHTNIVPVFGVGEHEGLPYYVMQFIQGQGLDEVLEEVKRLHGDAPTRGERRAARKNGSAIEAARSLLTGRFEPATADGLDVGPARPEDTPTAGRLSDTPASAILPGQVSGADRSQAKRQTYAQSVARIGIQVADALDYAHKQGVLHRDIKPSNLLLDTRGIVWVTDFGLAKADDQQDLTRTGDILGTLRYLAPEGFEGRSDLRSDLYSLGLTLYELLAFRPAFDEKERNRLIKQVTTQEPVPLRRRSPAIPRDLETIVHKAIDREPARRYQTAAEMAEDLRRFLGDEPIRARRLSLSERLARWGRRNPAIASLVAALVCVVLAGFGGVLWQWQHAEAARGRAARLADQEAAAREQAEALRAREQSLRLIAQSSAALPSDPGLALLLAIEGAGRAPGLLANNALLAALDACREERTLPEPEGALRSAVFSADGRHVVTVSGHEVVRLRDAGSGEVRTTVRGDDLAHAFGPGCFLRTSAVLSPDGRRLLTTYEGIFLLWMKDGATRAYTDRVAHLWDASTGRFLCTLRGHTSGITSAVFSPDGRQILTASWDRTARLWDAATGQEIHCLRGHQAPLVTAVFSPDGGRVLTLTTPTLLSRNYPEQKPGADPVDLDPPAVQPLDRQRVAGWGGGGISSTWQRPDPAFARVWDATTGKELLALKGKDSPFPTESFAPALGTFSPDGRRILTCWRGVGGGVAIWDAASGQLRRTLRVSPRTDGAWFSPDGQRVLTLSPAGARLWDAATGQSLVPLQNHTRPVTAAQFSPDGRWIVTASEDRTARLWNAATGAEAAVFRGHSQQLISAAFSPDSRRVVTTSADGSIRLWRVTPDREHARPLEGHQGPVYSVAFSPDGRRLVTASEDRTTRLWDAGTGKEVAVLRASQGPAGPRARQQISGPVRQATFSSDGRRLLTVAHEPYACLVLTLAGRQVTREILPFAPVRLWDATTGREAASFQWQAKGPEHPNYPGMGLKSGIAFARLSADSKRVLTVEDGVVRMAAHDGLTGAGVMSLWQSESARTVRVWDAGTGKELAALKGHEGDVAADFSPDGACVVTGSRLTGVGEAIRLWDAASGKDIFTLKQQAPCPYPLFSTDGRRILGFQRDRLRIWDPEGNELGCFDAPERKGSGADSVTFAALSSDGRLAVAVCGNEARLWDALTGKSLCLLTGHEQTIHSAHFSPDGRLVVTASEDETARIWDTATGAQRHTLSGHSGAIHGACFSPDGKTVATACADGTARLWPIDVLAIARTRKPRELTVPERTHYEIDRGEAR